MIPFIKSARNVPSFRISGELNVIVLCKYYNCKLGGMTIRSILKHDINSHHKVLRVDLHEALFADGHALLATYNIIQHFILMQLHALHAVNNEILYL